MNDKNPVAMASRSGWFIGSLVAGCVLGLPAGWLLAYLGMLPMLLGLFFYLLFGLLIGAVMVRVGRRAAPVAKTGLWLIAVFVAVLVWTTSLVTEYWEFPRSTNDQVRKTFVRSFTKSELEHLREQTHHYVLSELQSHYRPGGFLGYLRWAATQGTMECPRVFEDSTENIQLPQRRVAWLIRVLLGLIFLVGTVVVQTLELTRAQDGQGTQLCTDTTSST